MRTNTPIAQQRPRYSFFPIFTVGFPMVTLPGTIQVTSGSISRGNYPFFTFLFSLLLRQHPTLL